MAHGSNLDKGEPMRIHAALKTLTLLCTLSLPLTALAGSLDTTRTPATGSGMPTTADLYNQLVNGATKSVPASFQEPVAGPTAGTGKSLADIQGLLPAPDANGAKAGEVLGGKSFWGLRTDGTWGVKTGTAAAGGAIIGSNGVTVITIPDGLYTGSKTVTATDANLSSGNIRAGVTLFGVVGKCRKVAATGQTVSYATGNDRDDGYYQYGCAPAVAPAIGSNGAGYNRTNLGWAPGAGHGFVDNGDTVTDTVTGLNWTKNANLPGALKTWAEALAYVAAMNSGASANYGYTDWRLPNINELRSLLDLTMSNPVLPASHPFTSVQANYYWSSSTSYSNVAWNVNMGNGNVNGYVKTGSYCYVWPVRSGQ